MRKLLNEEEYTKYNIPTKYYYNRNVEIFLYQSERCSNIIIEDSVIGGGIIIRGFTMKINNPIKKFLLNGKNYIRKTVLRSHG